MAAAGAAGAPPSPQSESCSLPDVDDSLTADLGRSQQRLPASQKRNAFKKQNKVQKQVISRHMIPVTDCVLYRLQSKAAHSASLLEEFQARSAPAKMVRPCDCRAPSRSRAGGPGTHTVSDCLSV